MRSIPFFAFLLLPALTTLVPSPVFAQGKAMEAPTQSSALAKFEPEGNGVYHGASLPDTWDENGLRQQIQSYNAAAGKKLSVVTWFASAYEAGRMTTWRQNYAPSLARVKRAGAMSLIKFSTQDYAYETTRRAADLRQIALGSWDEYFKNAAETVRDFKDPVFISFDHEMNGNWYPYSQSYPGSKFTTADFIAAWRRMVSVFRQYGATNAAFVWSPNVPDVGDVPFSAYYPGDDFVDWIGVSFYSGNDLGAMDKIYRTYAPKKPFFITEWATAPEKSRYNPSYPGDTAWIQQFFAALNTRYPRVKAISWFNWNKGDGNYLLSRVPEQSKVYAQDIAAPRYLSQPNLAGMSKADAAREVIVFEKPDREVRLREIVPREVAPREIVPREVPKVEVVKVERPRREPLKLQILPTPPR